MPRPSDWRQIVSYEYKTTYAPKKTNHVLHLLLTMGTCGMWGFVWVGVALYNAMTKDKYHSVTQQQSAWYGQPIARPYAVGPGAPVSAQNPAPAVRPVEWQPDAWQARYPARAYLNTPKVELPPPTLPPQARDAQQISCNWCPFVSDSREEWDDHIRQHTWNE